MRKIIVYGEIKTFYVVSISSFIVAGTVLSIFFFSLLSYFSYSRLLDEAIESEMLPEAKIVLAKLLKSEFALNHALYKKIQYYKKKDSLIQDDINKIEILSTAHYILENGFFYKNFAKQSLIDSYYKLGIDYYSIGVKLLTEKYEKGNWKNQEEKKRLFSRLFEVNNSLANYDEALFFLQQLVELEPNNFRLKLHLGELYKDREEYFKAERILEQIVFESKSYDTFSKKASMLLLDIFDELLLQEKMEFYFRYLAAKGAQSDLEFIKRYADFLYSYYNIERVRKFLLTQYSQQKDEAIYEHLQSYKKR